MRTKPTQYISKLTKEQVKGLPDTYGIPVRCAHTVRYEETRKADGETYDLDFDSITEELSTALDIGLENYGSGMAAWEIPRIIKGQHNMNKMAATWQLYCSQVANEHDTRAINKAWKAYTPEQQDQINAQLTTYLDYCAEYLHTEF